MAERRRSSSRSGGSGGNAGCIVWLILLCAVLLLFLLNWGKIQETLERTNFNEIVKTERDSGREPKPAPPQPEETVPAERPGGVSPAAEEPGVAVSPPEPSSESAEEPAAEAPAGAKPGAKAPEPAEKPPAAAEKPAAIPSDKPAAAKPARTRAATLYFVRIDDDGVIVRQEVKRQIPATDSPLSDSLAALLGGPSDEELRRRLMSLVPQGTKLLSAQVRGSTAYLNFNEAFMYNHYGIEGYAGQLKQIVYTATAFSTVQDVQILIDGQRHDYLGGEGVYIGRPLSRNSF